jgi:hypothetical protein
LVSGHLDRSPGPIRAPIAGRGGVAPARLEDAAIDLGSAAGGTGRATDVHEREETMKKKIGTAKRLHLNIETLRSLQLSEVSGGWTTPTKPNASCFIQCGPTQGCPVTVTCPVGSAFGC